MIYDITLPIAPAMPKLGKELTIVKLLLSQVSKGYRIIGIYEYLTFAL